MGGARGVAAVVAAILIAGPTRAADLDAMERAVRASIAEQARLVDERTSRMADAAVLADEIARRKGGTGPTLRADRELEEALKRFDRLAGQLDAIDRRIADQDRTTATLRRRFEEAATAEAARLSGREDPVPIGQVARSLDAIDQARRRVAALGAAGPAFRPVLEIRLSPDDGAVEGEQKRLLLDSERDRVLKEIARVDAEANVLAARIQVKRRLSAELETAARTAGSDLALLRRESDNVAEALRDLAAQREARFREKTELSAALARVELRLEELRAALRSLGAPKGDVR